MSGVYIPGMWMPSYCADCPCVEEEYWFCNLTHIRVHDRYRRLDSCPLVPVTDHGRCVDADALQVELMDRGIEGLQTDDWHEIQQALSDAPTILPGEEAKW